MIILQNAREHKPKIDTSLSLSECYKSTKTRNLYRFKIRVLETA